VIYVTHAPYFLTPRVIYVTHALRFDFLTPKAFANLSPGFERSENPG